MHHANLRGSCVPQAIVVGPPVGRYPSLHRKDALLPCWPHQPTGSSGTRHSGAERRQIGSSFRPVQWDPLQPSVHERRGPHMPGAQLTVTTAPLGNETPGEATEPSPPPAHEPPPRPSTRTSTLPDGGGPQVGAHIAPTHSWSEGHGTRSAVHRSRPRTSEPGWPLTLLRLATRSSPQRVASVAPPERQKLALQQRQHRPEPRKNCGFGLHVPRASPAVQAHLQLVDNSPHSSAVHGGQCVAHGFRPTKKPPHVRSLEGPPSARAASPAWQVQACGVSRRASLHTQEAAQMPLEHSAHEAQSAPNGIRPGVRNPCWVVPPLPRRIATASLRPGASSRAIPRAVAMVSPGGRTAAPSLCDESASSSTQLLSAPALSAGSTTAQHTEPQLLWFWASADSQNSPGNTGQMQPPALAAQREPQRPLRHSEPSTHGSPKRSRRCSGRFWPWALTRNPSNTTALPNAIPAWGVLRRSA